LYLSFCILHLSTSINSVTELFLEEYYDWTKLRFEILIRHTNNIHIHFLSLIYAVSK